MPLLSRHCDIVAGGKGSLDALDPNTIERIIEKKSRHRNAAVLFCPQRIEGSPAALILSGSLSTLELQQSVNEYGNPQSLPLAGDVHL
jgi:hypothetical protein